MKFFDKELLFVLVLFCAGLGCFLWNNNMSGLTLVIAIVLFVAGLIFLIKGGDWFVDGATAIAEKFKIPEVLIGATIVSIGTTLPEVMVSAQAAAKGASAISYGNAIGSIICNVSLIAAITLAVKPAVINRKPLVVPVIFFFVAAAFYCFNAYVTQEYTRTTGFILLAIFAIYMTVQIVQALKKKGDNTQQTIEADDAEEKPAMNMGKAIVLLVFGAAIITFGATLLVDNGQFIAQAVGVPESVIALIFVALGTSLPELVTAITSLAKGHGALSVGNIIGANLFNLVLVSGLAITINPFNLPNDKQIAGMNASLIVDIPLAMLVMLILTVPALTKSKLYRWQGILLLALYVGFCIFQFA